MPDRARRRRAWRGIAGIAAGALGLGLAACPSATGTPPPGILTSEVAAGVARGDMVEFTLVPSIRALTNPTMASQIEDLAVLAELFALGDPAAEPQDIEHCVAGVDAADADGDGYPAMKTTQAIDCEFAGFRLEGSLELLDESDADPASGFNSELEYRLTLARGGETLLSSSGDLALWVSSMEDGPGYDVYYSGRVAEATRFVGFEARLIYSGTLGGTFAAGRLAFDGSIALAVDQVDCSSLAEPERQACLAQEPEEFPPVIQLAVKSAGVYFHTTRCEVAPLVGGRIEVNDDAGNVLGITYHGCRRRSATHNGAPLPLDEQSY